jgi:hypothetical protein
MDIPEFKPKGWRDIEGMGWLALVDCDRDRPRDASGLAGPVKVGGKVYECIASTVALWANIAIRRLPDETPRE